MLRRLGSRLHHASGPLALFLVLTGGTAYALNGSNTVFSDDLVNGEVKLADIGQGAVATDEIANNQVKAADIGDGEVRAADIGQGQVSVSEVATGGVRTDEIGNGQVQAEDLAAGVKPGASGARAWGLVRFDGALLRSKNITAVTHPTGTNVYCVDPGPGIDPTTAVMVVGVDFSSGSATDEATDNIAHVEWVSYSQQCPAGTMEVQTWYGSGEPPSHSGDDLGGINLYEYGQPFTFVIP